MQNRPMYSRRITEALKIAHWAETHYIDIVPHNPLGQLSAAAYVSLWVPTNVGVKKCPKNQVHFQMNYFHYKLSGRWIFMVSR